MKNERAMIMGVTYVIGFMTAFIAYEFAATAGSTQAIVYVPNTPQAAAVIDSVPEDVPSVQTTASVRLDEDGLHYVSEAGEQVISIAETVDKSFADIGHSAVYQHSISPSGQYVYFCAVPAGVESGCVSYVYDAQAHGVHRVSVTGQPLVSKADDVRSVWTADGILQLNQYVSSSATTPWVMQ